MSRRGKNITQSTLIDNATVFGGKVTANLTVQYSLIASGLSERLSKQRVRQSPSDWPEVEVYRDIEVRKFVGTRIAVSKLL